MANQAPVFVKISDYKQILDIIDVVKAKIEESRRTIAKINELKNEEDQEIRAWTQNLDEVNKRITGIDKTLFEPDN